MIRYVKNDLAISFRELKLEDANLFVSLFNKHYKRKINIEYFKWQFFSSPFKSKVFAAFADAKLVGYFGLKIYPISENINAGLAIDILTDESFRKMGVSTLLEMQVVQFCKDEQISILTCFPNSSGNSKLKSLGWHSIAKIDTLVFDEFDLTFQNENSELQKSRLKLIEFIKDNNYRQWRFFKHPIYQYEQISVDNNNFVITKLFKDPVTEFIYCDIVDVQCSQIEVYLTILLGKVIEMMKVRKVTAITTWALPHTLEYDFFIKVGFRPIAQERYFCVKTLNSSFESFYLIENWRLEESDAEIF